MITGDSISGILVGEMGARRKKSRRGGRRPGAGRKPVLRSNSTLVMSTLPVFSMMNEPVPNVVAARPPPGLTWISALGIAAATGSKFTRQMSDRFVVRPSPWTMTAAR